MQLHVRVGQKEAQAQLLLAPHTEGTERAPANPKLSVSLQSPRRRHLHRRPHSNNSPKTRPQERSERENSNEQDKSQ